jgi:hypothetical protein
MSLLIAAAVLFGFMAGTVCNFATQLKFFAGYDDSLDVGPFLLLKRILTKHQFGCRSLLPMPSEVSLVTY